MGNDSCVLADGEGSHDTLIVMLLRCVKCGYDLLGSPDAGCPEFGWGREVSIRIAWRRSTLDGLGSIERSERSWRGHV